MKKMIAAVWNYMRPSWEGDDQKFSYKRATAFVFVLFIARVVATTFSNQHQVMALLILTVALLLLIGIITAPQILEGLKNLSSLKKFHSPQNPE